MLPDYLPMLRKFLPSVPEKILEQPMAEQYTLLSKLNESNQNCKIIVRIERLWDIQNLAKNTTSGLDLIVLDEEGTQMHASILAHDLSKFKNQLREKEVVALENFIIQKKNTSWCPLNNPLKIRFKPTTQIKPGDNSIQFPKPTFHFTDFHLLQPKIDKTDLLTDVIGILKSVDKEIVIIETKNGNSPKKDLYITNETGQDMRITLWGKTLEQLPQTLGTSNDNKAIVIVTSTVVKKFDGRLCLLASFPSKVYVDMDLPETLALMNSSTKSIPKRSFQQQDITQVAEISEKIAEATKPFNIICQATITTVINSTGFYYDACTICTKGVYKRGVSYWCYRCKEIIDEPDMRLRIQFEIKDETGTHSITTFQEEAKTLLEGKDLGAMLNLSLQENGKRLVDEALQKVVGKTYKFHIKVSTFNLQDPDSPPTATKLSEPIHEERKKQKFTYSQC